ncbi:MAG: micrococcal nuclease [Halobacteriales archaeon]
MGPTGRRSVRFGLILIVLLGGCTGFGGSASSPTQTPTQPVEPTTTWGFSETEPSKTQSRSTATAPGAGQQWTVEVVRVVDGDTLEVAFPDGHTETVRLLGVDTPEVHVAVDPGEFEGIADTDAGRDWLRDWGHKASEFARTRIGGSTVRIAIDPEADRRGSYGRLLVYVYVDGRNFNRGLIEQGYARLYDTAFSKRDAFASAERTAREEGVGLWNFDGATASTPATAVTDGGVSLRVAEIHADATGNDHANENDAYLALKNAATTTVDLTGWTLAARELPGHLRSVPGRERCPSSGRDRVALEGTSGAPTMPSSGAVTVKPSAAGGPLT